MRGSRWLWTAPVAAVVVLGSLTMVWSSPPGEADARAQAQALQNAGNFKEAYEAFRRLVLDPQTSPTLVSGDLESAIRCQQRLGLIGESDALLEGAVAAQPKNWRLLATVARQYLVVQKHGVVIGDQFTRGFDTGQGQRVSSERRDRVRALQLLDEARRLAIDDPARNDVAALHMHLAEGLMSGRELGDSWRLQELTDLATLPEREPMEPWRRGGWGPGRDVQTGAAVDDQGNPIVYRVPESWDGAANDGQRWRWALAQAAELDAALLPAVLTARADFWQNQFGVETLARGGLFLPQDEGGGDENQDDTGTFALHTLAENETIARLATGVRRFQLEDEFNPIKLFERVAAVGQGALADQALTRLADIFTNRRQYVRAAELWQQSIEKHGATDFKKQQLAQLVDPWGRFEGTLAQPAGRGATIDFRFRNGARVRLTAQPVKLDLLLQDVKALLKSNPQQLPWNEMQVEELGHRLVTEDNKQSQKKYLGAAVADWQLELKPRPEHFDERITITTPLQQAGAYLLTADMEGGNRSQVIVWINDLALVRMPLVEQVGYFVADAVSGAPMAKANIELFGFVRKEEQRRPVTTQTANFAVATDADGLALVPAKRVPSDMSWLAIARTPQGGLAYLGFENAWYGRGEPGQVGGGQGVLAITDRPLYRPAQTVKYHLWARRARYDEPQESEFANRAFKLLIIDPQGNQVVQQEVKTDQYGGVSGEYALPSDAKLGVYQVMFENLGGGNFRVEEYKKPEFEVAVSAPSEPIQLGDKFQAKITAKYYFGAPVKEARVKYKVVRTPHTERWFPIGPWDWLYGPGYRWLGTDYDWYPGFKQWGCVGPIPPWWGWRPQQPPEIVVEQEVPIGPDGTVSVEIDTAPAKALHGNEDHRYEITAEVVDQSRRTVVGTGSVLAARQPFAVTVWTDRGHYRAGETIEMSFAARTLDGRPVAGTAVVELLRIDYDEKQQPVETKVETWETTVDDQGQGRQTMVAAQAGQYRVAGRVTDKQGRTIEGGYVFLVRGEGFDGRAFRFNDLELVLDRQQYAPGETVQLLVNTNQPGSTVVLFVRAADGIYPTPRVLRLEGKSTVVPIEIATRDMPNIFVEALTISAGREHNVVRQIVVPPASRVAQIAIAPSAAEYRPGEEAQVELKLTGPDGLPVTDSTVVTIYDKAVEAIAGGSNVPDIREFFWSWRRSHNPATRSSLARYGHNLVPPGQASMNNLGVFGETVVEETRAARGNLVQSQTMELAAPVPAAAPADAFGGVPPALAKSAGPDAALVQPTVRKQFADTAYWAAAVTPDDQGLVKVSLKMPDNLTTWQIRAWSMGAGTRVGQGAGDVITRKNLIVRLQAPRFFVERDEVVLSANVHNYLTAEKVVTVSLELDGPELTALDETTRQVTIAAGGEARVDWRIRAAREGQAVVRMKAVTDEESDAVEQRLPVKVHGILKTETVAGALRPDEERAQIEINIPAERRAEQSRLEIRYSPSLAYAMVDALPYLAEYPYGCTEQTLNRFLPAVITQRVLERMGLDLAAIGQKRTNLNAQELGEAADRARQWQQWDRNPVFDQAELDAMVAAGVQRLTEMQLSDGGWGWFSGWGERSGAHTTATVVRGLLVARANEVPLVPGVLENGIEWLKRYQAEQVAHLKNAATKTKPMKTRADDLDALVYMVLGQADVVDAEMREFLYRDRLELSVYSMAMLALSMHAQGQQDQLAMLVRNIEQYVVEDDENQTAWLRLPETWWLWYGSENEALAYYLKLLARVEPQGRRASRVAKYLINNRKHGARWNSTRDTALCVEALADFIQASGEDKPELTVEIWIDGKLNRAVEITAANLFQFDNRVVLSGDELTTGRHAIEIRKRGKGPLYFNAYTTNFTLEEMIAAAGLEVRVERNLYRLVPEQATDSVAGSRGQVANQRVERYRREELTNPGQLQSGDLIEIELVVESKNDYEYVVFEDHKAAGLEPVELLSGYAGGALGAYLELRDDRAAFFLPSLPRGRHSLTYRLRAEFPGQFSALPALAEGMYAPELRGNSDENKLDVSDRPSE